jgi:hypothetical protein
MAAYERAIFHSGQSLHVTLLGRDLCKTLVALFVPDPDDAIVRAAHESSVYEGNAFHVLSMPCKDAYTLERLTIPDSDGGIIGATCKNAVFMGGNAAHRTVVTYKLVELLLFLVPDIERRAYDAQSEEVVCKRHNRCDAPLICFHAFRASCILQVPVFELSITTSTDK